MRLLELEINNVRGIPHLVLKPSGENLVIWGPNGSGKSAVVDAVDFLLTGRISRLTGTGTGNIKLTTHGPHIDHKPEEANVSAIVQLNEVPEPTRLERCMANPSTLQYDKRIEPQLSGVLALARQGHHVLTRREILKYITAEPGTRAQQIQELLNIKEIEDIRKVLVKIVNQSEEACQGAQDSMEKARGALNATAQQKSYREIAIVEVANSNRRILGGKPLATLSSRTLMAELTPPTAVTREGVNVALLRRDIENLKDTILEENQQEIAKLDAELRAKLEAIRSDPELLRALKRRRLTELGVELIDETGNCPLCDLEWPPGELHEYLEKRLSAAKMASEQYDVITKLSNNLAESVNTVVGSLHKVVEAVETAQLKGYLPALQSWLNSLHSLANALSTPVDKYLDSCEPKQVERMLAASDIFKTLSDAYTEIAEKYPATTTEQTAWDTLTRLDENLKRLERAESDLGNAKLYRERATTLLDSFQGARDNILGNLYQDIKHRFVDLYRQLHQLDEADFDAKIEPKGAGLNFEVDFYGRDMHPPHALHSEGHQDSMGICLYLALAERLTEGVIDLVILDDVVMSVDADHRKELCRVLTECFPKRQFLITTHDKTWAEQLRHESVTKLHGVVEFYNWSIESGPSVNYEADIWNKLEKDLQRNDVLGAAARLRNDAERFFATVCDALQIPVRFKLDYRWDLGDFLIPAMDRYSKLLKKAKEAAKSWEDTEQQDKLDEINSIRREIYRRTKAEDWAVNASVHYNNWANLSTNDFRPVVEAFQDLYGLFICQKCGAIIGVVTKGNKHVSIRCNCRVVDWNLVEKAETD